jgi:hypothetical protein
MSVLLASSRAEDLQITANAALRSTASARRRAAAGQELARQERGRRRSHASARAEGEVMRGRLTGRWARAGTALWVIMLLPAAMAAVVDGQPTFNPSTNTGLYVWRTAQGDWQVRLLAAAGYRTAAGALQTGQRLTSARGLSLEADDRVEVTSERTVSFELHAARHYLDGLVLSAGTGDMCLRVAGNVPIFLGRSAARASAPVDLTGTGACRAALPQPSALEVVRTSKLDWQVRLASDTAPDVFDGRIESDLPLEGLALDSIEAADRVGQPTPETLALHLEVWPRWYDALRFTMPEGSRLCLRSNNGRERIVSLQSPGQQAPLRVVTPVDVTNNGACGAPADPFPPPTYRRKFHPGHYVVLTSHDDDASLAESVVHGVKGFVKRYRWRLLEPRPGVYDFSAIESDLELIAGYGLQLVALIEDKTFVNAVPTPDYLRDRTMPNRPGGYTVVRWDPYVVARYKALVDALGRAFDAHPSFEGIAMDESAHGILEPHLSQTGYTAEKYRDVLVDELISASRSLPRSRVFWFMNFIWEGNHYIGEVARRVSPFGVVMGGPDVMPDELSLQIHPYPFYDGALGHMPLFGQVEPSCYHHPHADPSYPTTYWTPQELFEYARDELHVSYMFWVRWRWRLYPDSYDWWDAIPVIGSQPRFNQ